jgi:mono/diheme cytochrome c family protein
MPLWEKLLYKYLVIPQTRQALLRQKATFAWQFQHDRPMHGRGRVDPFNPMKFRQFELPEDGTVGNADIPAIWNQKPRSSASFYLHWDGLSRSFMEVAVSSAIGDGTTRKSVDIASLEKLYAWLGDWQPPRFERFFPGQVDHARLERGKGLYQQTCAGCHQFGGKRTGSLIPLQEVGTDPNRAQAWTENEVKAWKEFARGYPFAFESFGKHDAYVAVGLDGIWLRAPYLHNGSVPSLRDLLEPPARRTKVFYRGYDVYDPIAVGFLSQGAGPQGYGSRYDTSARGNGNQGHLFGTDLPDDDKRALLEYLKTL